MNHLRPYISFFDSLNVTVNLIYIELQTAVKYTQYLLN